MLAPKLLHAVSLAAIVAGCGQYPHFPFGTGPQHNSSSPEKEAFLDNLVNQMTVPEMVVQLHLMFAGNVLGLNSDNSGFDAALASVGPDAGLGVMHDWYPTNQSQYNDLQALNLERSRLKIPLMVAEECLHGVGSFKMSLFPQSIGLSASFDPDLVQRVGRAIGSEARSFGIHACFSPVLDIGKDPRWGRVQEAWGEDFVLTSHMGIAYSSGLSKNGSWSDPDAVIPVMKHFAAHGSPEGGRNTAPFMGRGVREILMESLVAFKAAFDLGGVKGIMMAYHELDEVPSHINPLLHSALADWGYDGFIIADDTGMRLLQTSHRVAGSPADAIGQWHNSGGMVQFYDYGLEVLVNATQGNVANGTVSEDTLRARARSVLSVKYDLGLFDNPFIPDGIDPDALAAENFPLTLEAAHKSIVLLENKNQTLPLKPAEQGIKKIALIGPFGDTFNYGDYSGNWGQNPATNATTIRQAIMDFLEENATDVGLVSSWGANSFQYYVQYVIPGYHLSTTDGVPGGLSATYFADTNFSEPFIEAVELPNRDWGMYPPLGLPSNNFSAIWEGTLSVPVDGADVNGYLGVAVFPNTTAKLFVDDDLLVQAGPTTDRILLLNAPAFSYSQVNGTAPPPGSSPFTFRKGATHKIRLEYQAFDLAPKRENENAVNAIIQLFWNLVDIESAISKAVDVASDADIIVLAVGAAWNSDAENGDRGTLGLAINQTALADAIFDLGKPVVMVLEGGRPFAIPEYYEKCAAAIDAYFPGQSGGQAISDVLFGKFNPGGRIPTSVPFYEGTLPSFYNFKPTSHAADYTDIFPFSKYSFGYGLSYTSFSTANFNASSSSGINTFTARETIRFHVDVTNEGDVAGSYVTQVYLLGRVSTVVQPLQQLVAFQRVYLDPGQTESVMMELEADRYLPIVNRTYQWELERGEYTFVLLDHSGFGADTSVNATMICVG